MVKRFSPQRRRGRGERTRPPSYISPEQAQAKKDVDIRSDIYSLGCTLFQLLTGLPPFQEENTTAMLLAHVSKPPPDPRSIIPELPEDLSLFVTQLMAKAPSGRPQTPGEVAAFLEGVAAREASPKQGAVPEIVAAKVEAEAEVAIADLPWAEDAASWRMDRLRASSAPTKPLLTKKLLQIAGIVLGALVVVAALVVAGRAMFGAKTRVVDDGDAGRGKTGTASKPAPSKPVPSVASVLSVPSWAKVSQEQIEYAKKSGLPVAKELDLGGGVTMKLVLIPPREFVMGDDAMDSAKPAHKVRITKPFYVCVYEVTQAQYEAAMGKNPSQFKGKDNPVERISWMDATEFCRKLSEKTRLEVRLPTEAEWEYACRAGTETAYWFGGTDADLADCAWYDKNSDKTTHAVGQKKPNRRGLYDVCGNVWEWYQDWYDVNYYKRSDKENPQGPQSGAYRVGRGGAWCSSTSSCGSAVRDNSGPAQADGFPPKHRQEVVDPFFPAFALYRAPALQSRNIIEFSTLF